MIKELRIKNFRCYDKTTIKFNGTSILVGRNNAGKSTLIEALKIISTITKKYRTARIVSPPEWVEDNFRGISPNVENMNISDRGIFHMYGNPPATIEAYFDNGTSIRAYVGEWLEIFAVVFDSDGCEARNAAHMKQIKLPVIEVLPQISAVLENEKVLKKSTIDSNRATRLASRNFRNQLYYYDEYFPLFQSLVESTWDKLRVFPIESTFNDGERFLQFFVRINAFDAEIAWMGHGLQMWIQTMWFISQCEDNSIVVLDEPDVYMHADLQRRLIRLVTPMFSQLIVATHSLEIIEEVTSDCLIPIDSTKREIKPIGSEVPLQFLTKELGSHFNIDLARVFISSKFLILDGDDTARKILSAFQSVLYPKDLHPLINLPKAYINGLEDWNKVKAIADLFMQNNMGMQTYCILSSQNLEKKDINEIKKEAKTSKIISHFLEKADIDFYALNEEVIYRYISSYKKKGTISIKQIKDKLKEFEKISSNASRDGKPYGRCIFNLLSEWTEDKFGVSISARHIASYFKESEIPDEIKIIISDIMK